MKKSNRGGARPNSGPKLHGAAPKVTTSIVISQELLAYLGQCEGARGVVIEKAVRGSGEFKRWAKGE